MTDYADASAVESVAADWPVTFLECRTRAHNWRPLDDLHNTFYHVHTVTERCGRCKGERTRDEGERGEILSDWGYDMKPGYYLEGIGRIAGASRNVLRRVMRERGNGRVTVVSGLQAKAEVPRTVLRDERQRASA